MRDGFIRKDECLTFIAITSRDGCPAQEWFATLDSHGRGQFASFARLMDRAHRGSFNYSGRVTKISGSRVGLLELRITPPGGRSPHLRLFGVIRGDTVWLAYGYTKKEVKLNMALAHKSERLVSTWEKRNSGKGDAIRG